MSYYLLKLCNLFFFKVGVKWHATKPAQGALLCIRANVTHKPLVMLKPLQKKLSMIAHPHIAQVQETSQSGYEFAFD